MVGDGRAGSRARWAGGGEEPEQPFSGKFVLRVDPQVHRAIARAAEREGVSINRWAETLLANLLKNPATWLLCFRRRPMVD